MGGNALKKNIEKENVVRLDKKEYLKVEKDVIENLLPKVLPVKNFKAKSPRFIKNKETFGDLDIIIGSENNKLKHRQEEIKKNLKNYFKDFQNFEYFFNDYIFSFSYPVNEKNVFQVDLIFVNLENFESSLNYLSDNDFSNFLGRMVKPLGLKISQKGLEFRFIYDGNELKKESILLTKDWKEILKFMELDIEKWKNGFETEIEMFDYLIKSKFFNHNLYPLENLNHINRMRDKKRKNYNMFLKYLKEKNINKTYDREKYKDINIELLKKYGKYEVYLNKLDKFNKDKIFRKYFNGNVVKELFNVEGKELGLFMKTLKNSKGTFFKQKAIQLEEDKNFTKEEKIKIFNSILTSIVKDLGLK